MQIYQITNRITGQSYIGQTVLPLKIRWRCHRQQRSCPELNTALADYGVESFDVKTLLFAESKAELNYYEEALIRSLNTLMPNGYNVLKGGTAPMTDESRQRLSHALKGRKFSVTHRQNLSKAAKGRVIPPVSDETRQRLSEAATKMWKTRPKVFKKHTPEAIEKIREASTGRKHTKEAKAKISQTRIAKGLRHTPEVLERISAKLKGRKGTFTGRCHSDTTKQKLSLAGKGRKHSEEARQKIAEASKKMWESRSRVVPYKPRPSMKGRIPWNKGKTGFQFLEKTQN